MNKHNNSLYVIARVVFPKQSPCLNEETASPMVRSDIFTLKIAELDTGRLP